MTQKEVAQLCMTIRKATNAWRNEDADDFEQTVNVWFECLKDVPYEMAQRALREYLLENKYPPSVSDIYKPYKEWLERQDELRIKYNNIYYKAISHYPCYMDSPDERKEFDRICGNNLNKAMALSDKLIEFVKTREREKNCIPTLINWLKGIDSIE